MSQALAVRLALNILQQHIRSQSYRSYYDTDPTVRSYNSDSYGSGTFNIELAIPDGHMRSDSGQMAVVTFKTRLTPQELQQALETAGYALPKAPITKIDPTDNAQVDDLLLAYEQLLREQEQYNRTQEACRTLGTENAALKKQAKAFETKIQNIYHDYGEELKAENARLKAENEQYKKWHVKTPEGKDRFELLEIDK